jgi:hypothetical protein
MSVKGARDHPRCHHEGEQTDGGLHSRYGRRICGDGGIATFMLGVIVDELRECQRSSIARGGDAAVRTVADGGADSLPCLSASRRPRP